MNLESETICCAFVYMLEGVDLGLSFKQDWFTGPNMPATRSSNPQGAILFENALKAYAGASTGPMLLLVSPVWNYSGNFY
jgi:hypothetical protein